MSKLAKTRRNQKIGKSFAKIKGKYLLIVFFLFTISFAYSQTELETLEKAYKHKSKKELKNFFETWSNEISPITDAKLSQYNDTIQQAYRVFVAFYKPCRLDRIGGSEWGYDIYKNVKFLIVQTAIKIYFTDSIYVERNGDTISDFDFYSKQYDWYYRNKNKELADSIMDFRPNIQCNGKIPLFLTKKHEKILYDFLEVDNIKREAGLFITPTKFTNSGVSEKGQFSRKKIFLENHIKIGYAWNNKGTFSQLHSYPYLYSIIFDKNIKYAIIYYRIGCSIGGKIAVKKESNKWVFFRLVSTWIE
jgi:hypothetical protein